MFSSKLYSQKEIKLDNNLTGILSTNNTTTFGFSFVGNNSLDIKKLSIDLSTNYATRFSPTLKENELIQRQNIGFEQKKWDAFITHQFNYSLIRQIKTDTWLGTGIGLKFLVKSSKISFSYATIYQSSYYFSNERDYLFRHSFRSKIRVEGKKMALISEYYFQPNIKDFNDLIIYGTTKINLFYNKQMSFVIQDVVNYRNTSDIKVIHNLTLGIGYKFNKTYGSKTN